MSRLTHDRPSIGRLKSLFKYDPETGLLTWSARPSNHVKPGDEAGCVTGKGYRVVKVDGVLAQAHRLIWAIHYHQWPKGQIDHVDGDKLNNRIANLRECSFAENTRNRGPSVRNTSGHVGVSWIPGRNRWRAQLRAEGRIIYLGYYAEKGAAIAAHRAGMRRYHPTTPLNNIERARSLKSEGTGS